MSYEVLPYKQFGKHLLNTQELDPIYVMLYNHGIGGADLKRWCLAYWCFYSAGVASAITEAGSAKFHDMMRKAQNKRWPRGAERRHFRGEASNNAIKHLRKQGRAEDIVDRLLEDSTFQGVCNAAQQLPLFGPWISFKIADMAEQVLGVPMDYSDCYLGIYKDPRQGAALIRYGDWKKDISDQDLMNTVNKLIKEFKEYDAPPHYNRKVGIMEVETILCKYKSHYKGSYPLHKDSIEVYHGLEGWGQLAGELQCHVPNQDQL